MRFIISGTAGTGKSYLIQCLKQLLGQTLKVIAPTGVAAFNVQGYTIHNLLDIQVKGEFKDLTGDRLVSLQQSFIGVKYIIIDEKSMVGRKLFEKVDGRPELGSLLLKSN